MLQSTSTILQRMKGNVFFSSMLGIVSQIPGFSTIAFKVLGGTGGTISARYCYSVWLRHLVLAHEKGLPIKYDIIAELGPGDSLGIGLAALLTGANTYYAFDVVKYTNTQRNLRILDKLVNLFSNKVAIPNQKEFPLVKPVLKSYAFPKHILTDDLLDTTLSDNRIKAIKSALVEHRRSSKREITIHYIVPWHDSNLIQEESVDMVFSQAVMEHVDNLKQAYFSINRWLKKNGFMSHVIDFSSHNTSKEWNGHWKFSEWLWWIIRGKRKYLLNRQPHSTHVNLMKNAGFHLVSDLKKTDNSGINRSQLSLRFAALSDEDLYTRGTFIQAIKKEHKPHF